MNIKSLLTGIFVSLLAINYHLYVGDIISDAEAGGSCGHKKTKPCYVKIVR